MKLDLRAIFTGKVKSLELEKEFDMSHEELDGVYPLKSPVKLIGTIKNSADVVKLKAKVTALIVKDCDRCCKETEKEYSFDIDTVLVLDNQDNDDYVEVPAYELNLYELVRSEIVLNLPVLHLCSEECKGICPICGANLNDLECDCESI